MTGNLAQRNFSASMRLMQNVGFKCARLPELGELKTMPELIVRARLVRSALNARSLFESLNKNFAGLSEALVEFEKRKRRIAAKAATPRKSGETLSADASHQTAFAHPRSGTLRAARSPRHARK